MEFPMNAEDFVRIARGLAPMWGVYIATFHNIDSFRVPMRMRMKFGIEKSTIRSVWLLCGKFHPCGAKCRTCWTKSPKIDLWVIKYRLFALWAILSVNMHEYSARYWNCSQGHWRCTYSYKNLCRSTSFYRLDAVLAAQLTASSN